MARSVNEMDDEEERAHLGLVTHQPLRHGVDGVEDEQLSDTWNGGWSWQLVIQSLKENTYQRYRNPKS